MSLSVLASESRKTIRLSFLPETQAYADSSILIFLVVGSSSDKCPSEIDKGGLGERCNELIGIALPVAAVTSESWLSIVAMKDPNAASDLALSLLSALASLD